MLFVISSSFLLPTIFVHGSTSNEMLDNVSTVSFRATEQYNSYVSWDRYSLPPELQAERSSRMDIEFGELISSYVDQLMERREGLTLEPIPDDSDVRFFQVRKTNDKHGADSSVLHKSYFEVDGQSLENCTLIVRKEDSTKRQILRGLSPRNFYEPIDIPVYFSDQTNTDFMLNVVMKDPNYEKFLEDGHELISLDYPKRCVQIQELLDFMPKAFAKHNNFEVSRHAPGREHKQTIKNRRVQTTYSDTEGFGAVWTEGSSTFFAKEKNGSSDWWCSNFGGRYRPATAEDFLRSHGEVLKDNIHLVAKFLIDKKYFNSKLMIEIIEILDSLDFGAVEKYSAALIKSCLEYVYSTSVEEFQGFVKENLNFLVRFICDKDLRGTDYEASFQELLGDGVNFFFLCHQHDTQSQGKGTEFVM